MAAQSLGASVVLMERFDAERALAAIERHRVTVAQFVPTHLARMLALPAEIRDRYDIGSLKAVFHAGGPCSIELKRAMIDWLGPIVHEYYGGTEGVGLTVATAGEWLSKPGSVGRAVMGAIRICDADGNELPVGQEGAIFFSDGRKFRYHKDEAKTRAAHNRHGWPTMGDIGRIDADGYLYLTDRASFMIISGGVNIYPREVEDRITVHPAVVDIAVLGMPDQTMGEVVTAVIQPSVWPVDEAALTASIDAFARQALSGIKVPRRYIFLEQLPRTDTGKVLKAQLKATLLSR